MVLNAYQLFLFNANQLRKNHENYLNKKNTCTCLRLLACTHKNLTTTMKFFPIIAATISAANAVGASERMNEFVIMEGHTRKSHEISPLPHT